MRIFFLKRSKNLRFQKYADKCGPGLNQVHNAHRIVASSTVARVAVVAIASVIAVVVALL